jgi:hypothetical protein
MAKSPTKPFRIAPLQRLTVKPIDDPAEQAKLDKRLKLAAETMSDVPSPANGSSTFIAGGTDGTKRQPSAHSSRKRRR